MTPFKGCNESKSLSYLSLSTGLTVQSTAVGGKEVIKGVGVAVDGGGGFFGFGRGISPCRRKNIKKQ